MDSRVYTVYETAKELGCTSHWVRVLLAEQKLAGAYKVDGVWQIPAEALKQRKAVSA